jgi:hypothetical protein
MCCFLQKSSVGNAHRRAPCGTSLFVGSVAVVTLCSRVKVTARILESCRCPPPPPQKKTNLSLPLEFTSSLLESFVIFCSQLRSLCAPFLIIANIRHAWLYETADRATWEKMKLISAGGVCDRKKCKWVCGGFSGVCFLAFVCRPMVGFALVLLARMWIQWPWRCYTFNLVKNKIYMCIYIYWFQCDLLRMLYNMYI